MALKNKGRAISEKKYDLKKITFLKPWKIQGKIKDRMNVAWFFS